MRINSHLQQKKELNLVPFINNITYIPVKLITQRGERQQIDLTRNDGRRDDFEAVAKGRVEQAATQIYERDIQCPAQVCGSAYFQSIVLGAGKKATRCSAWQVSHQT